MRVQIALGKNAKINHPQTLAQDPKDIATGQMIVDAVTKYLSTYLSLEDGSNLTTSIISDNLATSASFSAKSARLAYLLGKVSLLGPQDIKGIVRTQIIEYGSVAEAILLDLIQSIGIHDSPAGKRPTHDASKKN